MTWNIARNEALNDPEAARAKVLARLRRLAEVEEAEALVVGIVLDAVLLAEAYRGARHQIPFLPEMTRSVDKLLRELELIDRADAMAAG